MNTQTLRQMEIGGPETMNWTPFEVPVADVTEKSATQVLKGITVPYLLRRTHRAGRIATRILIFLTLGVTGLWAVVDLVKIAVDTYKTR